MTPCQLHRAVARATGEDIGTIRHMGFSVADSEQVRFDPEPSEVRAIEDRIIDWDRQTVAKYTTSKTSRFCSTSATRRITVCFGICCGIFEQNRNTHLLSWTSLAQAYEVFDGFWKGCWLTPA